MHLLFVSGYVMYFILLTGHLFTWLSVCMYLLSGNIIISYWANCQPPYWGHLPNLIVGLHMFWTFICTTVEYVNSDNLMSFFLPLYIVPLDFFPWLGSLGWWWLNGVTVSFLVVSQGRKREDVTIQQDVSCRVFVAVFYQIKDFPSQVYFTRSFYKCVLNCSIWFITSFEKITRFFSMRLIA